jgi:hypothetical protein
MSTKIRTIVIAANILALTLALAVAITSHSYGVLAIPVTLLATSLLVLYPARVLQASIRSRVIALVALFTTLVLSFVLSRWWIVPVLTFILQGVAGFLWKTLRATCAAPTELTPVVASAIRAAGLTVADEVMGWHTAASATATVVLLRQVTPETGDPRQWKSVQQATTQADSLAPSLKEQGVAPLFLLVVYPASSVLHRLASLTVVSPDRLSSAIKNAPTVTTDLRALAEQAGFELSRTSSRALQANQKRATTTPKVLHQGRTTKKK